MFYLITHFNHFTFIFETWFCHTYDKPQVFRIFSIQHIHGFLTSPSQYNLNINLFNVHTILLDGPDKSLAQCEIILQYIEIYRRKRPFSPYTMYAGVELFKFNIYFKIFKCNRSMRSRFSKPHTTEPYNKTGTTILSKRSN